jgi:hypothetical protein
MLRRTVEVAVRSDVNVSFAPYSVEKVALSGGLVIFFQSLRVARNFDSTRQRTRFHLINGG